MEIKELSQSELVETNGGSLFLMGLAVGIVIGLIFLD